MSLLKMKWLYAAGIVAAMSGCTTTNSSNSYNDHQAYPDPLSSAANVLVKKGCVTPNEVRSARDLDHLEGVVFQGTQAFNAANGTDFSLGQFQGLVLNRSQELAESQNCFSSVTSPGGGSDIQVGSKTVQRVQNALNVRECRDSDGNELNLDGKWGRLTQSAYDSWSEANAKYIVSDIKSFDPDRQDIFDLSVKPLSPELPTLIHAGPYNCSPVARHP